MSIVEREGQPLQNRDYRQHLNRNWDALNDYEKNIAMQFLQFMQNPPKSTVDEITQARIDANGSEYPTIKPRIDAAQRVADVAYSMVINKADKDYIRSYLEQLNHIPETVANLAELIGKYPGGKAGLFIAADNGHKYIWSGGVWKDAGVYQSEGIPDKSIKAPKVADKTLTDQQIKEVNMATVIDSFATISSAEKWNGGDLSVTDQQINLVSDGGDRGVMVTVNLDKFQALDKRVYVNFDYSNPDYVNLKDLVEVYAMDMKNEIKKPALLTLKRSPDLTPASYGMSGQLWPNWQLDKNFKLLFVIHGQGSLKIDKLTVNYSDKRLNLADQLNNIDSDQVVNLKTEKVKNTSIELDDFSIWNSKVDTLTIDDALNFQKNGDGDSGVKVSLTADTTKPVYINFKLQTNGAVDPYVANAFGSVVPGAIATVKGNTLRRYGYRIEPDKFTSKGIKDEFMVIFATHVKGTYFKVKSLNVSNTNGLEGVSETTNNVLENIGVRPSENIGSDIKYLSGNINAIEKVHYVTPANSVTINNGILKMITAFVNKAGVYSFSVGLIDQNKLIVDSTKYQFSLTAGLNYINVESKLINMPVGSYLFMDASQLGGVLDKNDNYRGGLLVQDDSHQSTVPGYPGMIMYNYDGIAPFSYEVAQKSVTHQLEGLNKASTELKSSLDKITANGDDVFVTSTSGKKFRLLVDDSGALSTVSQIPNEVAIFGNSLTKTGGEIGMAASDQYHDYYHFIVEYMKSKNTKVKVNPRTNMSVWESATNSNDRKTLFNEQIKPVLTANTDLVILQLVDNVNTPEKKATFAQDTKTLIKDIHAVSPKARVFWIAYWFGNDDLLGQIKDACNTENATLIDISSIARMSDTKSYLGATRTGVNGETWTVTNPGEAMHPGDKGMRLIADAVIGKLGF